jgi:hypothetical protein
MNAYNSTFLLLIFAGFQNDSDLEIKVSFMQDTSDEKVFNFFPLLV